MHTCKFQHHIYIFTFMTKIILVNRIKIISVILWDTLSEKLCYMCRISMDVDICDKTPESGPSSIKTMRELSGRVIPM